MKVRWLLALTVLVCLARIPTLSEPPERDITTYAIIGMGMLEGRHLYADLWDHKPPGIHVVYAAAQLIAGESTRAVYLLSVLTTVLTLVGIWQLCEATSGGMRAAKWASVFWLIVSGTWLLAGNSPNTEAFVNAAFTWAMVLLIRAPAQATARSDYAVGALFLVASLFKHLVVVACIPIAAALFLSCDSGSARLQALIRIGRWVIVGATGWAALGGAFALASDLREAYDALIVYNSYYGGDVLRNVWNRVRPGRLLPGDTAFVLPMAMIASLAFVLDRHSDRRRLLLLAAWAAGAFLIVAMHELPYSHYRLLWLPPVCVGAGWGLAALGNLRRRWARAAAGLIGGITVVAIGLPELMTYRYNGREWSELRYNDVFAASEALALQLKTELPKDCAFYQFGSETGLYFHSGIRPPVGVTYAMPLMDGPLAEDLIARTVRDLDRSRPCMVIVSTQFPLPEAVGAFIDANYEEVGGPVPIDNAREYTYYQRHGVKLPAVLLRWRYQPLITP